MHTKVDESSKKVGGLSSHFYAGAAGGLAFAASMKAINTVTGTLSSAFNRLTSGLSWGAELAMQAEQSQVAFEVMLGSAKDAKNMMQDINSFALSTPFDVQGVTDGVTLLKGMGIATEDLLPAMKTLGDMSLGNKDKLGGLALAFGQVNAKGKLMSQEFNQLAERGINLRESLAKELKIEVSQVAKAMEDGKISANVFRNALVELANTQFGGMMDKQAKTLKGTLDKMKEQFGSMFRGAMETVFQSGTFKEFMDMIKPENLGGAQSVIASILESILKEVVVISSAIGNVLGIRSIDEMRKRGIVQAGGDKRGGMNPAGLFPTFGMLGLSGVTLKEQEERLGRIKQLRKSMEGKPEAEVQAAVDALINKTAGLAGLKQVLGKPAELEGLKKTTPMLNWVDDAAAGIGRGLANLLGASGRPLLAGLSGINANVSTFVQGIQTKQPDLTRSTAGLQVGSSEAFSQLIKHMTGGGAQKIEEKQLEAMKETAKGVAKLVDSLTTEGMTLLGIVDSL